MLSVNQIYLIVSTSLFGFVKDFLIILGAWLLRKKVVVHLHGGGYRLFYEQRSSFGKWVIRWTLRRTNRIIVLGELLRAQFDFLDSPERIAVVPNGMAQLSSRSTSSDPKSAPGPNEPWRFLYLSNLMETKGYFVLMEACELLSQGSKNFQADFCGAFVESSAETGGASTADQLQSNFMRRINEAPLSEQLTYRGIPEEIVHGETGWMLKKGQIDKDHLSETLATLMDMSAEEYSEMSKRAHQFYLDHFTKEKHLNNMLKVINSV
jgi:glycosyltransferase involved in cell wall biosynthesis